MKKVPFSHNIAAAAGRIVSAKGYVSAIDLFVGLGWLLPDRLNDWKQGRVGYLERVVTANLRKLSGAMRELKAWATHSGLRPSWTAYRHRGLPLQFSKSGLPVIEKAYSTHYVLLPKSHECTDCE